MPIIPKISIADMDSIQHRTEELLTYHCGCHGNLVTIAMRYAADAFISKNLHSKYKLNTLKTKELLRFQCGCYGN